MTLQLSEFKALTFDCYGTLIDWETGIWDALQPLLKANDAAGVERAAALAAFGECEHAEQQATPTMLYPALLAQVHRRIAEKLALTTTQELDDEFGQTVPHWPAFADSAETLRYLKSRYKLVILSNVDRKGIAASCRKLGVDFDAIYTAEDIGAYKPADVTFEYLLAHLARDFRLKKHDVLHTAQSLLHDHAPANRFGLANAWIDRQRLSVTGNRGAVAGLPRPPRVAYRYFSLAEMAEAVRDAID